MLKNEEVILKGTMSPYNLGRLRLLTDLIPASSSAAYALDVGCSTGIMAKVVRKKGYTYVGLDVSKDVLLKASRLRSKGTIHFLQGDVSSLPFKRCFKLVIALEIIEHLKDPYKLLTEINNILLDRGYLIISTPNKVSPEGIRGKIQELVLKKRWSAWNIEHKHIFSSFEFLYLFKENFSILRVGGYYFLPRITFTEKFEGKWWFCSHLRFLRTHITPLNMLGFQTIALLKKVRKR